MPNVRKVDAEEFTELLRNEPVKGVLDLTEIDLRSVNMSDRHIRDAFYDAVRRAKDETNPFHIDMSGSNISGCGLYDLDFSHVTLAGVNAERTIFSGSDFSDSKLDNANANFADFRYATLNFTRLYNTSIIGANFTGADLRDAKGLMFEKPGKATVDRLGVCRYINYAKLPPKIEALREKIQDVINRNFPRKNTKSLEILEKSAAPEAEYAKSEW